MRKRKKIKINILASFYKDVTTFPVLESTEFALLSCLSKEKYRLFIINHTPPSKVHEAREEKNRIPPATVRRWVIPFYNKYINMIFDFLFSIYVIFNYKIDFLYSREIYLSCMGIVLKTILRKKSIFRMKALFLQEREYLGENSFNLALLKKCEKLLFEKSDLILPCSDNMTEYLKEKGRAGHVLSIPNYIVRDKFFFDQKIRERVRVDLGIDDRLVFIFSGGPWKWQCLDESMRLFKLLLELDKRSYFMVLSYEKALMQEQLKGSLDKDYFSLLSLEHDEIPPYLMAGDFGFMLRARGLISDTSSPIKFGEYIGCGLPVAIAEHLGDFPDIVQDKDFGVVIDNWEDEEGLRNAAKNIMEYLKSHDLDGKKALSEWANTNFTWENNIGKFEDGIKSLLS